MEAMEVNTTVEDTDIHQMPLRATMVDYTDWVMIDTEEEASSSLFDMSLLPEEILERILSYLSPYKDMDTVKLVSKQWHRVMKSVVKHIRRNFNHRLLSCNLNWTQLVHEVPETDPRHKVIRSLSISERFFHSAAYVNESMYVFGGISSTNTTFNDLWRLDLTSRRWVRPVAMGSYPSPKAKATMVVYNDKLYLFGGWSQPTPTPLHQSSNYFSELHQYDPISNRWSLLVTIGPEPEPLAGHSASVVGDLMVVFGGTGSTEQGSNKVWLYDFLKCSWSNPVLSGIQPEPRHNQFQCTLDDQHVLVMGGTYGTRLNARKFSDVYILTMHPWDPWYWTKLTVLHPELSPELSLCHSQCKVNDTIVILDLCNKPREAKNEKPRIMRVEPLSRFNKHNGSSTTNTPKARLVPQEPPQLHNMNIPPQPQHPLKPHSSQATPQENGCCCCAAERLGSQTNEAEGDAGAAAAGQPSSSSSMSSLSAGPSNNNRSLLALQQRLHRDYMNLPDRDNHHHKPQGEDNDVADSHIERLQNRQHQQQQQCEGGGAPPPHNCQRNAPPQQQQHDVQQQEQQQQDQHNCDSPNLPKVGTGQAASANGHHSTPPSCRHQAAPPCRHHVPNNMPSIRPNATSNRQRQLEALQRHEELLRSRSRALAAARFKKGSSSSGSSSSPCASSVDEAEPPPPPTIMTKDRLDIYTLDLSRAVTESTVEWKPLSQIQPPGAPTEAFRCSLVVGRGELIMFGGIRRDKSSPRETSVTQNNVYFLHP